MSDARLVRKFSLLKSYLWFWAVPELFHFEGDVLLGALGHVKVEDPKFSEVVLKEGILFIAWGRVSNCLGLPGTEGCQESPSRLGIGII